MKAAQIVRCVKTDFDGDLEAGASYCERIAAEAKLNPFAPTEDAHDYQLAAEILRKEDHATDGSLLRDSR